PVRLVSAALWKVMKERDVMQYGIVEEFVTSACDTVPGLLTLKHQAKLTLGLRARVHLILELCKQPDPKTIAVHMKRIQVPASHSPSEVFPVDFGPKYDQELEKLLWEFLIRLDQLLPVPNLPQTVSWLNDAPPVLEECARAATQPQLLKVLLQHQSCLGHLEAAGKDIGKPCLLILHHCFPFPSSLWKTAFKYTSRIWSIRSVFLHVPVKKTKQNTNKQTNKKNWLSYICSFHVTVLYFYVIWL
uniref:TERF1-interacting nuclear factor 2 N-terminal domain-containing protein n=1 Tax=Periophthalmus magnuspinnatus TaxID=409849 RepID=A0A3B4B3R1_9GOBI